MSVKMPEKLSAEMKEFWKEITGKYELFPHDFKVLEMACRSWDAARKAQRILEKEGFTCEDRYGQIRAHPAAEIEAKNKTAFQRLMKDLRLDGGELPGSPGAPPGGHKG